jgi:4'-phosphopantetheinyl transferase
MLDARAFTWSKPESIPPLGPEILHLWKMDCGERYADPGRPWAMLTEEERGRARRFRNDRHRRRYVRAHAGLRQVLSLYLGTAPQAIDFRYGIAGKPCIAGDLEFNLTTTADLALAAVRLRQAVGIDCELLRPRSNLLPIAERMFEPDQAALLASAPEAERLHAFTLAWTALEASVKADGRGLFRSRTDPPMRHLDVVHFIPEAGCIAAVAGEDLPHPSRWVTLSID